VRCADSTASRSRATAERGGDDPARVHVRFFAAARDAAGRRELTVAPQGLGSLLATLRAHYGPELAAVLETARVWVNGDDPVDGDATALVPGDEVAVVPPVSGGVA
jgi:molybdopterin synthase sulfur carrier subunit